MSTKNRQPIATNNTAAVPTVEDKPLDELEFDQIRERFKDAARISFRKYDPETKRWARLGSMPADIADEDFVIKKFKAGLFQIRFHDPEGKLVSPATIVQFGSMDDEEPPPAAAAIAVSTNGHQTTEVELLRAELARRDNLMLELIHSIRQPGPSSSIAELVTALASLQKIQGTAVAPPATFSERLMDRALDMALKGRGAEESESETDPWIGFAREVFQELKPQLFTKPNGNGLPAEQPAAAAADNEPFDMTDIVDFLKDQCRNQRPPESIAKHIAEAITLTGDFMGMTPDIVRMVLAQPYTTLSAADPELATPGYKVWFEKLLEVLRVQFLASARNTGRAAGD